jgi:3-deoxy-7-phosphoheptulonate synthase
MIWIGERTRQLDGAHVEFARGLENPVGIKISENFDNNQLELLIRTLNPLNEEGKIVLITRMGTKISEGLPRLVEMIKRRKLAVLWISDPMHGNTVKLECGIKTRYLEEIKQEYEFFHTYLKQVGIHPGGIHLELTGRNVTECLYKNNNYQENMNAIQQNYQTGCDPRLSADQCIDLAFFISSLDK